MHVGSPSPDALQLVYAFIILIAAFLKYVPLLLS